MIERPAEHGSFRDRTARVFYRDGKVYRGLDEVALANWEALSSTRFFRQLTGEGKIVATRRVEPPAPGGAGRGPGLELPLTEDPGSEAGWAAVLEHETIPFVSYPYEWTFGMLRDAALLQLDLLLAALEEGMVLKDASAFNVQWRGTEPVFIDVPSFEKLEEGHPWAGYRQFCEMCLYPLMLQAYKDVPFQPWLRGNIDGIPAAHCARLMSLRDWLRPGVLKHVVLQARAQSQLERGGGSDLRDEMRQAGFSPAMIVANARGLRKLVAGLSWDPPRSAWSEYAGESDHYDLEARGRKSDFVGEVARWRRWGLVWDLGCNVGAYSRVVAEHAGTVVALDADHLAVERLYRELRNGAKERILPLVGNLADPSPNLGWRGLERRSLPERGRPELVLALALVHHLVIGANIPVEELVGWLAGLGADLAVEFVSKDDPKARLLMRNKDDRYADYERGPFERCLSVHFEVVRRVEILGGHRILYFGRNRSGDRR